MMIEALPTRTRRALSGGALSLLALTAAGCGGSHNSDGHAEATSPVNTPSNQVIDCSVLLANSWLPLPSTFNVSAAANLLAVQPSQVEAGGFGPANCPEGVDPLAVDKGQLVIVKGMGEKCLAIGFRSAPIDGQKQQEILAACAAPLAQTLHAPTPLAST